MTEIDLQSISVTNFRTIGPTMRVPLDAPVVLIHGSNGAGKTSILSALELALTGSVAAMQRTDPSYLSHSVHRGADFGTIQVIANTDGVSEMHSLTVRPSAVEGSIIFDPASARFFSERCFLAQSTLSRLLEIYEGKDDDDDESPLTRFVNDLLGLNLLDAFIDGLHGATHLQRTRNLVSHWGAAERLLKEADADLRSIGAQMSEFNDQLASLKASQLGQLHELSVSLGQPKDTFSSDEIAAMINGESDDSRLVELIGRRRELSSISERLQNADVSATADQIASLESEAQRVRTESERWRTGSGSVIEQIIDKLRRTFPDLPSSISTDPLTAVGRALERVQVEIQRLSELVRADDLAAEQITTIGQALQRESERATRAAAELSEVVSGAVGAASALSALLPYIEDELCPVCGRDFSEISTQSLANHLSEEVTRLNQHADRMNQLNAVRVEAENNTSNLGRQLELLSGRRLNQDERAVISANQVVLSESEAQLSALSAAAESGSQILRAEAEIRRELSDRRNRAQSLSEIRAAAEELGGENRSEEDELEPIESVLRRMSEDVEVNIRRLEGRQAIRRTILEFERTIDQRRAEIREREARLESSASLKAELTVALAEAEARRSELRRLSGIAVSTRGRIIRQVFNDSLNSIWRDLFIRLAPNEQFVPAFNIPETSRGDVRAQLITQHVSGGQGGSPGATLSAGNLNTAALTLFLALHLVAGESVPWIILDDPVQSMDEIHVAQFAALLRTLSKEHHRRVVVAVHERPLFEYLSLELSPAYAGDRLITVEVSKSTENQTSVNAATHTWRPDPVHVVAS